MKTTAVLIPCYNESATIERVIMDFKKALPNAQIYVYDNNSTDQTAQLAQKAGAVVRYETRQGKGNVMRSMFRDIDADCYILVDGDDTYPAENAQEMEKLVLENNVDMVIGDRLSSTYFTENKRKFHNGGNVIVRKMVNTFFQGDITDIMTGYRAFSFAFVKSFPILSTGFEIETEMTIHALDKHMHTKSIPVQYRDRPEGSVSKLNTISDGVKVLLTIVRMEKDYRPIHFFTSLAVITMLIAGILFYPVLMKYLAVGIVTRMPTLVISAILGLSSLLFIVCGLILGAGVKQSRQEFEIKLNEMMYMRRNVRHEDKIDE